jgi:hypothetical protein
MDAAGSIAGAADQQSILVLKSRKYRWGYKVGTEFVPTLCPSLLPLLRCDLELEFVAATRVDGRFE